MTIVFENNTTGTVTGGGTDAPAALTVESWTVSTSSFPTKLATGAYFHVCDPNATSEKIKVTAITGSSPYTWTTVRGDEGTTPVTHSGGFTINQVITSGELSTLTGLWPSGDTTGATDAAAINAAVAALPATGGVVNLQAGKWYVECGIVSVNGSGIYLSFAPGAYVYAVGAGDVFRIYDSSTYGSRTLQGGGILGSPIIDGTNTTTNSCAVHIGDIFACSVFAQPINFGAGTTSKGIWADNNYYWTELMSMNVKCTNCTTGVVFDVHVSAGTVTGSFDRGDLYIYIDQVSTAYSGCIWQNGALMVDGHLTMRGNYNSQSGAVTSAVLQILGQTPGGAALASYSGIGTSWIDLAQECASGTHTPQTIVFTNGNNQISNCYGQLDFGAAGNTFAVGNNANNILNFNGYVAGDPTMATWIMTGSTNAWLGAPQTISTTVPTTVTAISAGVTGYTTYVIRAWIPYASTSAAGTPKFAFTGPGGQLNTSLRWNFFSGTALASSTQATDYTATITGPTLTSSASLLVEVEGTVFDNTDGTLSLTAWEGTNGDPFNIGLGAYMTCLPVTN